MRYCRQCKIKIADPTNICPLCQSVLEKTGDEREKADSMYPVVGVHRKGYKLILQICAFVCFVAIIVLALVNYLTYNGVMWSIICDAGILYLLVTLRFTLFNAHEGHTMKILMQVIAVMLLTLLIDYIIGYQGWSVAYAFPVIILVADMLILILMMVNFRTWYSYILLQMAMLILSGIIGAYILLNHMGNTLLAGCAIGVSALIFLGSVCLGDIRARNEIKRRFHV
nr:hypothetical protein [Lachnospiraceae bacterium]